MGGYSVHRHRPPKPQNLHMEMAEMAHSTFSRQCLREETKLQGADTLKDQVESHVTGGTLLEYAKSRAYNFRHAVL